MMVASLLFSSFLTDLTHYCNGVKQIPRAEVVKYGGVSGSGNQSKNGLLNVRLDFDFEFLFFFCLFCPNDPHLHQHILDFP
jgi:hypothetical protein